MSDKHPTKRASKASQPALAQILFAAIQEHDAALDGVARVLHDDVGQVLSAVGLQLDAMRMDFRDQAPGLDDRAAEIQTMLEQVIEQLRDISNELNPSIVESAIARPRCSAIDIHVKRAQGDFVLEIRDNAEADAGDRSKLPLARLLLDYYASKGRLALDIQGSPSRGTVIRASHPLPDSVPEVAS